MSSRLLGFGLLFALAACSGGGSAAEVPDGYQLVEHPDVSFAVPTAWEPGTSDMADVDPESLQYGPPDAAVDVVGALVFRAVDENDPEGLATVNMAVLTQNATGAEQTRRESVDIAGAEEGFLLQNVAESEVLGGEVRMTYVTALIDEGQVVAVRLIGTEEQFGDDDLQVLLDTMEVGG